MQTQPQKTTRAIMARNVCAQVRRHLAAGELSPAEIAQVVDCPVSTVYTVRARTNKEGRAAWVNAQFAAMDRRIVSLERIVGTANERISALEIKRAKTRR